MTDDRKDEAPAGSAEEWPKRAGPTIDLDASDVSGDTHASGGTGESDGTRTFFQRMAGGLSGAASKLVAPVAGAVAAVLVLAAFWAGGLIGPPPEPAAPAVSPAQFDNVAANVGDLTARVARVEAATKSPPTPAVDPALASKTESLEKSLSAVREEIGKLNGQLRTITTSLNEVRAAPRDGAVAAVPDLGPLSERLTQLEDATRALATDRKSAADDINVRRLVVANTLDVAVRRGEPFAAALTAAKQVAADPNALGPLDAFAARGIAPEATYLREVVGVLQRIADSNAAKTKPVDAEKSPAGAGILDRLQSGVTKLVRVERDTGPATAAAPAAAVGAPAVRREDLVSTRKDVANLPQAADPQVQAWLKSVDAREAALAASQKFSAEALAAFGKSGQ